MDQEEKRSRTTSGRDGIKSRSQTARGQAGKKRSASQSDRRKKSTSSNRSSASRKAKARRRRRRNLGLRIFLSVVLVIAIIIAAFLWKRYSPTKETYDLNQYYGIEKEGQMAIIVDNTVTEPRGMIADGKAYVQYETVRDYINSRFYWDPNENVLLYTLPNDMVSVGVGSKEYSVSKDKKSEDYVILKTEGSTAYIALDFIQQYTNIEYEVYDNPGRVMIITDWGETTVAKVKKDTQVRYQAGVKSPILTEISKGDEVTYIEDEGSWKKVRTEDGFIGYVRKSTLKKTEKKTLTREFEEPVFTSISKDYTINLVWHNVTNSDANSSVQALIDQTKGLTTIAPTWFHVLNTDGDMESIASADYVYTAHQDNIEVWATIRDFDSEEGIDSYDESYALLSSTSSRENLINQLIAEAIQVGIDGINVDFEKISVECGEHFIQFIRELSVRCRQNGIVLSVDNYVPQSYNLQYDRKEQGIVADYVIIMGYDEHYAGSEEAGSVSSYNYVKNGIEETLTEVPAEKIISGIPFFTRLWKEGSGIESEALGMDDAAAAVASAGVETTWDDETKQNYATWKGSDGRTYEIWLEDASSIEPKLQLMKENGLGGTAAWALGLESADIWNLILQYVN